MAQVCSQMTRKHLTRHMPAQVRLERLSCIERRRFIRASVPVAVFSDPSKSNLPGVDGPLMSRRELRAFMVSSKGLFPEQTI